MCKEGRMREKILTLCEAESLGIAQSPSPAWIYQLMPTVNGL